MAEGEVSLDREVRRYKQAAFAESTKSVYRTQIKKYIEFCKNYGYEPVPASSQVICRYVAYLAQTMCPSSIKQYLNVVRILHLENGMQNPVQDDYILKSVIKGIERVKGNFVRRKLPITVDILKAFLTVLDLKNSQNLTFWAASLVAFFGMMRKSSLFPHGAPKDHLCLSNCTLEDWGIKISVSYSKTIQCQERKVFIALPWNVVDKQLCPVATLLKALKLGRCCQATDYVFTFLSDGKQFRMTYELFTSMLRNVIKKLNLPVSDYSGHSFRRGGASCAFYAGIPPEIIQAQGDWRSLAYLNYIDQSCAKERAGLIGKMYIE